MSVEVITDSDKEEFEYILQQIDNEYETQEILRTELNKINTKINAAHLASKNSDEQLKRELFYASVKIFDNIIDLIEFYGDELRAQINNVLEKDKDFYVIDLKLSQLLLNHELTKKWLFNICIANTHTGASVNKSINLKNNISNRVLNVTAMNKSVTKKVVTISLVWPSLNYYWPIIKLSPIEIDISYHFQDKIREINKPFEVNVLNEHSYRIITNFSQAQFCEVLLKNCYHRLDVISSFDHQSILKIQFIVDETSLVKLEFDTETTELKMHANSYVLKELKTYFYNKMFEMQKGDVTIKKEIHLDVHKRDLGTGILDLEQLKDIYKALRN